MVNNLCRNFYRNSITVFGFADNDSRFRILPANGNGDNNYSWRINKYSF
jgi:hypothetical protein